MASRPMATPRRDEAKPGETFMKIGVGLLEKPADGQPYKFYGNYRLVEPGTWSTNYGDTWIEFVHTLHDRYGYSYNWCRYLAPCLECNF